MTWSWSHTAEAYEFARQQLAVQERDWLETAYAEWKAFEADEEDDDAEKFNLEIFEKAKSHAEEISSDILGDFIWSRMEEQAECTNGGWEAHACPYGCHLVPFSKE